MSYFDQLQTRRISAQELRQATDWPDNIIEEFLTILDNIALLAEGLDSEDLDLGDLTNLVNAHIGSDSQHGADGVIVGVNDFAQSFVGGVVYLATKVANALQSTATITLPDIGTAPATYDQVYQQEVADLLNDAKSKHNQLVTDLNALVSLFNQLLLVMQSAKQMSLT